MTMILNKIVFIFIFLMLSVSTLAASELSSENRGPVEVTSDRLEVDDLAQTLVFMGNAVATQDDVTIHGNRLTVKYTGEKREIEQVVAEGAVRILQGARVAVGERAVLYHLEERIVLTGSPEVRDGDNFVKVQEITVYLNDKRSVVTGGSGGRVKAIFTPKTEEKP